MEDLKLTITPTGNELVIRTGDAEKIIPPQPIKISGTISAPADWLNDHTGLNSEVAFVQLDAKAGTIVYHSCPSSHLDTVVTGALKKTAQFERLKINGTGPWSALKLAKHLKECAALSTNKADHMLVVASLEKLKVKVNTALEKFKEENGNAKFDFERTVDSSLKPDLSFTVPIYEGEAPVTILAKIVVDDINNGDVVLLVVSYTLEDELEQTTREILKREEVRFQEIETNGAKQTRIWTA